MDYIVDNKEYIIGHNKKGEAVNNFQVHEIIAKIIFEIDRVCRKNDIPYALAFGSALGLYNYGGFIPWDDDADIVIDYFDYDRFVEALKKDLSKEFYFDCEATNKRYNPLIPFMKIRYRNSYLKERNRFTLPDRQKECRGLFVDICFLMGVPPKKKDHLKLIRKSKLLMPLYVVLDGFLRLNPRLIRKSLKKHERKVAETYKSSEYISQTVIIPFQQYPKKFRVNIAFSRDVIYPFKEYDFLGKKVYSFNNIKEFSRLFYGEKALKMYDESKKDYIEPLPHRYQTSKHFSLIEIYK